MSWISSGCAFVELYISSTLNRNNRIKFNQTASLCSNCPKGHQGYQDLGLSH